MSFVVLDVLLKLAINGGFFSFHHFVVKRWRTIICKCIAGPTTAKNNNNKMFNGLKSEKRKTNLCVNSEKGAQTNVMCGARVFIKVRKVKHSQVTM